MNPQKHPKSGSRRPNKVRVQFVLIRGSVVCVALLVLALSQSLIRSTASARAQVPTEVQGFAELKKGDYEQAVKLLTTRLAGNPNDAEAESYLLRAYIETGRYAEAEGSAKKFLLKNSNAGLVQHQLAEVYSQTGRYAEAVAELENASGNLEKTGIDKKFYSDLRRAEVLRQMGQEDRAQAIFATVVKYFAEHDPSNAAELSLLARTLVHLERFQDANDVFRNAIEADPTQIETQLEAGELFSEKYNYAEAAQFYVDALQVNPNSARAHMDLAINKMLEGSEEMLPAIGRSLAINPNFVGARVFKAGMALQAGEFAEASTELEKAFKVNPRSLEAHSMRAAMLYLQDQDTAPEISATLAINPRYGEIFNTLSHFATLTRRTEQAAQFARRAVELSPRLWSAHLNLGMALLRLGQMTEGRAAVETSFKGDPFNVWAKNTLDLLDTMADFKETKRGPFVIKAAAKESDVLSIYAGELLEEAAAKLTAKYHFTPQGPIYIELFQNHDDFAVRALGLPGLGALGVCFGPLVAQDSPSARETGEFNWGSTLWHEFTHVITLQMTNYRVPRWFTEGLSVYEERRARPGWGDDWNAAFLRAFAAGRWSRIEDLDTAFQRPRNPDDLPLAYFQASQVCEFIVDRFGFDAILRMLALYRDKAHTPEVLSQALKLTPEQFDRSFKEYLEAKTRPLLAALKTEPNLTASLNKDEVLKLLATEDTFGLHMRAGNLLLADGDTDAAVRHFKRATDLFPYYTGDGNPYELLAGILEKKGDPAQAADALEQLIKYDENNLNALKSVARLRLAQGDRARALETLRLSFYVDPFDYTAHSQAGELSLDAKDYGRAVAEFQAALALQPPNIAEANYNLATAYYSLGRQPEAKRAVLRALESAPRYEKAQELLLKIVGQ
jgi:tetratricopeptide (TPR) repeat protein